MLIVGGAWPRLLQNGSMGKNGAPHLTSFDTGSALTGVAPIFVPAMPIVNCRLHRFDDWRNSFYAAILSGKEVALDCCCGSSRRKSFGFVR